MPKTTRRRGKHQDERGFLAWVCTKYSKFSRLSFFSQSRQSFVCLYDQYKIYLKNYSKSNFDLLGDTEARRNFETFMHENDVYTYISMHKDELHTKYRLYKSKTYERYRSKTKPDRKARGLYAVDAVHKVQTTMQF
jgi:hypothetical protein